MSGLKDRVLTLLPNALTPARLLAVPVVVALLLAGTDVAAVVMFVAAAAADFLDGRLARRRGGWGSRSLGRFSTRSPTG